MNSKPSPSPGACRADMDAPQNRIPRGTIFTPPSHLGLIDVKIQPLTARGGTMKEAEFQGQVDPAWLQLIQELLAEVKKRYRVGLDCGSRAPCRGTNRHTGNNRAPHAPKSVALQISPGTAGRSGHGTIHPSREQGALNRSIAEHQ